MKPINVEISDFLKMVELFENETDRGAAVLAGSYIENYLGIYLKTLMIDNSLEENIFGPQGALSTFSQRIYFACAFGYLPKNMCEKLHLIRKIRNHFAHHPIEAKFTKDPVKDWISTLKNLNELKIELPNNKYIKNRSPKIEYLKSVGLSVAIISAKIKIA